MTANYTKYFDNKIFVKIFAYTRIWYDKGKKICLRLSDSIYGVKHTSVHVHIYEIIHTMLEYRTNVNEVVAVRRNICAVYSEYSFVYTLENYFIQM